MRSGAIKIAIAIVLISIAIYFVKNNKKIIPYVERIFNSKYAKIIYGLIFILLILFSFFTIKFILDKFDLYETNKENQEIFKEHESKVLEENNYYKSIINLNYSAQNYKKPYIPEGFEYVGGEWNTGFVISDNKKNEYVWIPCTNQDNQEVSKLEKRYFTNFPLISKDHCYDLNYKDFLNSALQNGGFYISRYEIGKEDNNPVSKKSVLIWNNISQKEANDLANTMNDNPNYISELLNGYAYDTALEWIYKTNKIEISNFIKEDELISGRGNQYNGIYDICDNILELTLGKNYDTDIVRGVYLDTAYDKYDDMLDSNETRFSITENFKDSLTTFRVVLYKKMGEE